MTTTRRQVSAHTPGRVSPASIALGALTTVVLGTIFFTGDYTIYLYILSVLIIGWIVWEHATGRQDLLSLRNVFLLGFVMF